MAISGSDPVHDLNQALFGVRRAQGTEKRLGEATPQSTGNSRDTVAFSPEIKERDAVIKQIHALPDIRVDKLSPIQQALADGQFHIDGDLLAGGVIRETVLNAVA